MNRSHGLANRASGTAPRTATVAWRTEASQTAPLGPSGLSSLDRMLFAPAPRAIAAAADAERGAAALVESEAARAATSVAQRRDPTTFTTTVRSLSPRQAPPVAPPGEHDWIRPRRKPTHISRTYGTATAGSHDSGLSVREISCVCRRVFRTGRRSARTQRLFRARRSGTPTFRQID